MMSLIKSLAPLSLVFLVSAFCSAHAQGLSAEYERAQRLNALKREMNSDLERLEKEDLQNRRIAILREGFSFVCGEGPYEQRTYILYKGVLYDDKGDLYLNQRYTYVLNGDTIVFKRSPNYNNGKSELNLSSMQMYHQYVGDIIGDANYNRQVVRRVQCRTDGKNRGAIQ